MSSIFRWAPRISSSSWLCRRCFTTSLKVLNTKSNESPVSPARVRFAPSPTGHMHLGSLRTALYNYLLAKATGGQFILRIEDTDQKRTVRGAEESIFDTLRWAGLQWDEGPLVGGDYGPYRQSDRTDLHQKHTEFLLKKGYAYRCFCSPERLQALALSREGSGQSTDYDRHCLNQPGDVKARIAYGDGYVVRLKAPLQYPPYHDLVYGCTTPGPMSHDQAMGVFQDPILLKSDGMPTYHLANVVDDHFMRITHVVRATEWMSSTPKHVHLYNCFGWTPPKFVHVSLLQDLEGRKLSKRAGDVFVSQFRERGFLPEALNNFAALLGWSHDGESDVLDMEQLVKQFRTDRLTTGNTKVDPGKLEYLQRQHARRRISRGGEDEKHILDVVEAEIYKIFGDKLENGNPITREYIHSVLRGNIQNYFLPGSFVRLMLPYFFQAPNLDTADSKKHTRRIIGYLSEQTPLITPGEFFKETMIRLRAADWTQEPLQSLLGAIHKKDDSKAWTARMRLMRLGLTGGTEGSTLVNIMCMLGKERCLSRLDNVVNYLDARAVVRSVTAYH